MDEVLRRIESNIDLSQFYGVKFFTNASDDMTAWQWTLWFKSNRQAG